MITNVLLDSSVLVAFINKRERLHLWATEQWKMVKPPFLTCEAVITEACFLLQDVYEGEDAVMSLIQRQTIQIPFQLANESETVRALMRQYQNVPMSLADSPFAHFKSSYKNCNEISLFPVI